MHDHAVVHDVVRAHVTMRNSVPSKLGRPSRSNWEELIYYDQCSFDGYVIFCHICTWVPETDGRTVKNVLATLRDGVRLNYVHTQDNGDPIAVFVGRFDYIIRAKDPTTLMWDLRHAHHSVKWSQYVGCGSSCQSLQADSLEYNTVSPVLRSGGLLVSSA